jgi:hypothetical protein
MTLTLPFARLNLRWNPFGEPAREDRGGLAVANLPELRPGDPVQIIGERGRGKTTHLLALAARHPGAVYECVPEDSDRFTHAPEDGGVYLLDEAQRARPGLLRRLLGRPLSVALGTHGDLSGAAGRPLRTVRAGGMEPDRLEEVLRRRIEWARRGPGPVPRVPAEAVRRLIGRHGDDVRAIEGVLYELLQEMKEPGDVQV